MDGAGKVNLCKTNVPIIQNSLKEFVMQIDRQFSKK